jgi:hypothetical protein
MQTEMADAESMSALGHEQTFAPQKVMSALPPKADISVRDWNNPLRANSGDWV